MSRFVDTIITYRILKKLVQPIVQTDAYRLGIIDKNGNQIKKDSELNTPELRDAWTMLDRLIFRVRRVFNRQPLERNRLANLTTALTLVREHYLDENEYMYLETDFHQHAPDPALMMEVADLLDGKRMLTFRMFNEEGGGGSFGGAANSVGGGFSGQATATPNPNLAGRDLMLGKMARRKRPQLTGLKPRNEKA
jgi:hypothetical protein